MLARTRGFYRARVRLCAYLGQAVVVGGNYRVARVAEVQGPQGKESPYFSSTIYIHILKLSLIHILYVLTI